ncbi:MAG: hypothetical protein ACLQIQ_02265, partial [Beijerinckiaceae bacterium]
MRAARRIGPSFIREHGFERDMANPSEGGFPLQSGTLHCKTGWRRRMAGAAHGRTVLSFPRRRARLSGSFFLEELHGIDSNRFRGFRDSSGHEKGTTPCGTKIAS